MTPSRDPRLVAEGRLGLPDRAEQRHRERHLGAAAAVTGHVCLARAHVGEGRGQHRGQRAHHGDHNVLGGGGRLPGPVVEGDLLRLPGDVAHGVLDLQQAGPADDVAGLHLFAIEAVPHLDLEGQRLCVVADRAQSPLAVDLVGADDVAVLDLEPAEAVEVAQALGLHGVGQADAAVALHGDLLVDAGHVDAAGSVQVGLHGLGVGDADAALGRQCRARGHHQGGRNGEEGGPCSCGGLAGHHLVSPASRTSIWSLGTSSSARRTRRLSRAAPAPTPSATSVVAR